MAAFDVFSKKEIERIDQMITQTLESQPTIQRSAFVSNQHVTTNSVWKIESVSKLLDIVKRIDDKQSFDLDINAAESLIDSFQIWGYLSPALEYYVVLARVELKREALNSSSNVKDELMRISYFPRLLLESFKGYSTSMSFWKPCSPIITELWIKVDKSTLEEMRKIEIALTQLKNLTEEQKKQLSKELRKLEPVSLWAEVGDIHSHLPWAANVTYVIGHTSQMALGGLTTPFIEYLSYDSELLNQQKPWEMELRPAELLIGGGAWSFDYLSLVGLLSLWVFMMHLAGEREKIDQSVSELRNSISLETSNEQIEGHLTALNKLGAQTSSLQQTIGRISRQWKASLRQKSESLTEWALEAPVQNIDQTFMLPVQKGYLGTLCGEIISQIDNNTSFLERQATEISSLRTHLSDIVNLTIAKGNQEMQNTMRRLTKVSVIVAVIALAISVMNWIVNLLT